ncbi:DUF4352 domain-containing protein [Embleya sp. NPDC050493]|uniref:DUF4352 domain-containing protein n=1 Tax=Embleya sp. NPDC050493 TaxID=3363989 RepID=UPI0037ACF94B
MHTRTTGIALAVACTLALAGCNGRDDKVVTKPNKPTIIDASVTEPPGGTVAPTAAAPVTQAAPPTSAKPAAPAPAKVGDTLTLTNSKDVPVDVTLAKLVDPASSANQYLKPKAGSRYVAVQWKITNKGDVPVTDTPNFGSHLIDSDGQQFGSTFADTSAGPAFPSSVSIPPGGSRLGYVTYEVPTDSKITTIQMQISMISTVTGQWNT